MNQNLVAGTPVLEPSQNRGERIKSFSTMVLFVVFGGLIGAATYVVFVPSGARIYLKAGVALVSLACWLALGRRERWQTYRSLALSFFAVSLGVLFATLIGTLPVRLLGLSLNTVQGVAIAKLGEALPIVLPILIIHFALGGSADEIFLTVGKPKWWLTVSVAGIVVIAGILALQAAGSGLTGATVIAAMPWMLIFVFSNAFMEELWFRAIFIKKLEPLVGGTATILITSIVFATVHISTTYARDIALFMVALLGLGVLWAWLMRKSNSIWGAVLLHAAMDMFVMIGFIAGR